MKKSHIVILVIIAAAIGIIMTTTGDSSTYASFSDAYQMATVGNKSQIHVVGQLKKDEGGHVTGIRTGQDKVSFSFVMIDENGKEQTVYYNQPMPTDLVKSEKVVVVGSYQGDDFIASKILLKCPSKYQEKSINV